ncbi:MAG: hypothetical protein HYY17_02205 [Planctomycetes bacterium]|nr:hypothetical protein [Planctomycetota bacterium]
MREGTVALSFLLLLGCTGSPPVTSEDPPRRKTDDGVRSKDPVTDPRTDPVPDNRKDWSVERTKSDTDNRIKGDGDAGNRTNGDPARTTQGDDVLRLQRERVARDPSSDLEKLRTALLLIAAGDAFFPEAERFLSMLRRRTDFIPYVEAYLYRKLGETQKAANLHHQINEEFRQADGFKIERAELVSSVKGYMRYEPHPDGKVAPGSKITVYVQPRNFTLKKDGDRHTLHLGYDWKLLDDRNQEIALPAWDQCNPNDRFDFIKYCGPVSEFHQFFSLPLPSNLSTGNYRVRVTVTDKWTGRDDRIYVPFYVVPKS